MGPVYGDEANKNALAVDVARWRIKIPCILIYGGYAGSLIDTFIKSIIQVTMGLTTYR